MLTRFIRLLAVLLALAAAPAWAITLDEAKAQGLVGEKVDGYVAAVAAAVPAEVQALIESTNAGRRQVYADLARRNGISTEEVGILSAEKLRDKAAAGEYLQSSSGQWQRK